MSKLLTRIAKVAKEFEDRYRGKYYGIYRALLMDNVDPLKLGRVRVLCPTIWGNRISDWVPPVMPMGSGGFDQGEFKVPPVEDSLGRKIGILIQFDTGHKDFPIWTGTWITAPTTPGREVESEAPLRARGEPDESVVGDKGQGFMPVSPADPKYPYNRVTKTQGGNMEEVDDTPGAERYHRWHPSGHYVEVSPLGSEHRSIPGNHYIQVKGKDKILSMESREDEVGVDADYIVGRDLNYTVTGDLTYTSEGSAFWELGGSYEMVSQGALRHNFAGRYEGSFGSDYYLNVIKNVNYFVGSDHLMSIQGIADWTISGLTLLVPLDPSFKVFTNVGGMDLSSLAADIVLRTAEGLAAKVTIGYLGDITLENTVGSIAMDLAGNVTITAGPNVNIVSVTEVSVTAPTVSVKGGLVKLGANPLQLGVAYLGGAVQAGPFPGTITLASATVTTQP